MCKRHPQLRSMPSFGTMWKFRSDISSTFSITLGLSTLRNVQLSITTWRIFA